MCLAILILVIKLKFHLNDFLNESKELTASFLVVFIEKYKYKKWRYCVTVIEKIIKILHRSSYNFKNKHS